MKNITFKKVLFSVTSCAALLISAQSQAQNVSVQFGQPGFYGHVDVGNFPQPELVYRQPRIVQRVDVVQPPLYLVVPAGHRNRWDKNCYRYDACNRQVYFVQESWYNNRVVPRYRDGYYREIDRDHDGRRDYRERGHEHDYGHGH
ncbi:hypothetical protein [Undibacterium sp. TJN19]|uniref:hypothetical protein n=1 Tax=Undibacterium sp. TJN19 TaxID=3413055 RepID=UPI003BF45A27